MRRWLIQKLGGYPDLSALIARVRSLQGESELIEVLGGYPTLEAALDEIRAKDGQERRDVLTMAVKRLFNTVGPDDILKIHNETQWTHAGRPLRLEEITLLRAEAEQFMRSRLYKILQDEVRYLANKKMFIDSREVIDIVAGKLLLYYVDIVNTRIKRMIE